MTLLSSEDAYVLSGGYNGHSLLQGTTAWNEWEKPRETTVTLFGVSPETRIEYFPNTNIRFHYPHSKRHLPIGLAT
jgi:hypothetical protein